MPDGLDAQPTGLEDLITHRRDYFTVVGRSENSGARDKSVRARSVDCTNIVYLDATVDFKTNRLAPGLHPRVNAPAGFLQFLQGAGNELLSSETGVHRHQQDDVQL